METILANVVSPEALLTVWQGNRRLTRRVIEAFPEKDLFEFSIGGMRTFSELSKEFLAIAVPGLNEILGGEAKEFNDEFSNITTKEQLLNFWDDSTAEIDMLWEKIPADGFQNKVNLFGQYEGTVFEQITYFIENEIHHRGQGYVYLRALGIQPPFFWER